MLKLASDRSVEALGVYRNGKSADERRVDRIAEIEGAVADMVFDELLQACALVVAHCSCLLYTSDAADD